MTADDLDLLRQYAAEKSEDAFTALVNRHLNLVYSAALRQVRSAQLAEEVAQSVFSDLARSAAKLKPDTILTAWLYEVARRTAIDLLRKEARRQLRERAALEMNAMNSSASDWTQLEPLLDEAMDALEATDRAAVLLRYFENKSLRDVGQALGTTDDTAQKRVSRAVERLRAFFASRGVSVGAGGLAAVISANAVQAAPGGLAATISSAAILAGTTLTSTTTATAAKAIAMATLQKTVIAATVAVVAGAGIYEARQVSQLREQNQTLQQQQAPLADQIQQLTHERDAAAHQLATLRNETGRLSSDAAELLRLRGEVGLLRRKVAEVANAKPQSAAETVSTNQPDDAREQQRRMAIQKGFDGRGYVAQLLSFAVDHEGWFPTNWQQVAPYVKDFPTSGTNHFEMVYQPPLNQNELGTNARRTVLVREFMAWPTFNGGWGKVYGFADGRSDIIELTGGNFTGWEQTNTCNLAEIPR